MNEFKIFGIGLCKTGTQSLTAALRQMGISTVHYPYDDDTYQELRRGECPKSVMRRYRAATDLPVACRYAELDKAFPGSKFILTVRETEGWLASAERHWRRNRRYFKNDYPTADDALHRIAMLMSAAVFGCYEFNSERFQATYERHSADVTAFFRNRPGDLLILDICNGEGWDKLCPFLSLPIPEIPFPHRGRSAGRASPRERQ